MKSKISIASQTGVDTIVQLGDFGFVWPGYDDALAEIDTFAARQGVRVVFLPGNHEDWDTLENWDAFVAKNGDQTEEKFTPFGTNIFYTGKVNVWEWDDITFAVAGGAYSIDKAWRTFGESWWPQEWLDDSDIDALEFMHNVHGKPVDVLLTHDAPTNIPFNGLKVDLESEMHRSQMNKVYDMLHPQVWFHGHYHRYMKYWKGTTAVTGLNCDGNSHKETHAILKTNPLIVHS
jgi:hypothetical protein